MEIFSIKQLQDTQNANHDIAQAELESAIVTVEPADIFL
jgi:hypothetical protein